MIIVCSRGIHINEQCDCLNLSANFKKEKEMSDLTVVLNSIKDRLDTLEKENKILNEKYNKFKETVSLQIKVNDDIKKNFDDIEKYLNKPIYERSKIKLHTDHKEKPKDTLCD